MKTVLNVKVDSDIKLQAQALAKDMGVPLSLVVNANLREFIRTRSVTFCETPRLSPRVERELAAIEKDIKASKNLSPKLTSAKELASYLDSL